VAPAREGMTSQTRCTDFGYLRTINHFAAAPSALYGMVLLTAAIAYWVPQQLIISWQGPDSILQVDNYVGVHDIAISV
jgi:hypothetical protein